MIGGLLVTLLILLGRICYIMHCSRRKKRQIEREGQCEKHYSIDEENEEERRERTCLVVPSLCYTGKKVKSFNDKRAFEVTYSI